jgi:hypothetical protein
MHHYPPPGKSGEGIPESDKGLKRRDLLLGGTSLAAASSLPIAGFTRSAQAQPAPTVTPAGGRKPNILSSWATTSAGSLSARATWGSWATARPTSTGSARRARPSPTGTDSAVSMTSAARWRVSLATN